MNPCANDLLVNSQQLHTAIKLASLDTPLAKSKIQNS